MRKGLSVMTTLFCNIKCSAKGLYPTTDTGKVAISLSGNTVLLLSVIYVNLIYTNTNIVKICQKQQSPRLEKSERLKI